MIGIYIIFYGIEKYLYFDFNFINFDHFYDSKLEIKNVRSIYWLIFWQKVKIDKISNEVKSFICLLNFESVIFNCQKEIIF